MGRRKRATSEPHEPAHVRHISAPEVLALTFKRLDARAEPYRKLTSIAGLPAKDLQMAELQRDIRKRART